MKRCLWCRIEKNEEDFSWENKNKGRRARRCKECQRKYSLDHYGRNKRIYSERADKQRSRGRQFVNEYLLTHPCVDCSEADIRVLDFDHRGNKSFVIVDYLGTGIETLQKEIAKCDVRCGNCHRKKTLLSSRTNAANDNDKYQKRVRQKKRKYINEYLSTHPCVDCKETEPLVLEFDHIKEKKYGIAFLVGSRLCLETLKEEIKKCEVRCVNCHRKRHHPIKNNGNSGT